ncbi:B2 bradykinin receptor-like [Symphorus nematophorus]
MSLPPTSIPANSTAAIYGAQNNTNADNCSPVETENWIISVVPVYLLFITVLGIVFNVFVLMVFCLHKKPCTVAEIYLSNLAAADLFLMFPLPFWAVTISNNFNWIFGWFSCKFVSLGIKTNACCSIHFLVLISIDRYLALVHPMSQSRMRSPKFAKLGCVLVWGLGLLLGISTFIYSKVGDEECNATLCYPHITTKTEVLLYEGKMILFCLIIPLPIISFCSVKIIQALSNRSMEGVSSQKMEHKATTLVLVVLLAFLVCWVSYFLMRIVVLLWIVGVLRVGKNLLITWYQITTNLAFFNSVLNPIIYVLVGKNFQNKVKELFQQLKVNEVMQGRCAGCHSLTGACRDAGQKQRGRDGGERTTTELRKDCSQRLGRNGWEDHRRLQEAHARQRRRQSSAHTLHPEATAGESETRFVGKGPCMDPFYSEMHLVTF